MPTERKGSQWGPVYLDEFQSIEVRRLSNGARDLWVAVACRTRSAKNGPCSEQGYFASYEALARDLSRWSKSDAQLNPISVRTVKRYASELKESGLLKVQRTTGPACLVLLRPPSLRIKEISREDERAARLESVTQRGQNYQKRGQKTTVEGTALGVTYSKPKRSHNSSSEQGTFENNTEKNSIDKMSNWMLTLHQLGGKNTGDRLAHLDPTLRDSFSKLKLGSWHEAALTAPQAVRGSFAQWRPDGISESEFDLLIQEAGRTTQSRLLMKPESAVVQGYRTHHPELNIPFGASDEEADNIFAAELARKTGF